MKRRVHTHGAIASYVAYRYGAEVGIGATRELACVDAWDHGMRLEVEVLPVDAETLERAKRCLKRRTWKSELELVRNLERYAIQDCDPHGNELHWMADDELDARYDAIREARKALERGLGEGWFVNLPFPMRGGHRPMLIEVPA